MKLKKIVLNRSLTIQGLKPPGARRQFRDVEAAINAHGIAIPMPGTPDEVLIPWNLVDYAVRERGAAAEQKK